MLLAQLVNRLHGGAVVSAWDIGELDDVTIDVFRGLVEELPTMQRTHQEWERRRAAWLAQHPTYRQFGLEVRH